MRRANEKGERVAKVKLQDAVVLVSGASSGLGRATALAFAEAGSTVVLAARGRSALDEVANACRAKGATALVVPTDVSDAKAVEALAGGAVDAFGRIDVWVECAALLIAGDLVDHPPEEIAGLIDTNVAGTAYTAREALRTFREQGHGTLIMVSSLLGLLPSPLAPVYTMSKFAMRGLALSLRQAVACEPDIDVSVVLPGPIDTPMFDRAANHTGHELRAVPPATSPERVATAVVACARSPRRQTTAGALGNLILVGHQVAPRFVEWAVAQWSLRFLARRSTSAPDTSGTVHEPAPTGAVSGDYRLGGPRRVIGDSAGRLASALEGAASALRS